MRTDRPAGLPATDRDELSDRYVIARLLGRGGMGEVHLAQDQRLLRDVAVKRLLSRDPESTARFLREAQITGQLTHPNVPAIHDLGAGPDGALFFTMQALPGRDLASLLAERGPYGVGAGLQLFGKVCDAVAYAHSRGFLHRDLKPANVVVGEYGEVYVIDWGLAKPIDAGADGSDPGGAALTEAGEVLGTPSYMSPEHASGAPLDERADVYSLGAILYAILTGRRPFQEKGYAAMLSAIKGNFPRPRSLVPTIPWEIEQVVLKAMALDRDHRYRDVPAMMADVAAWLDGRPLPGVSYGPGRRIARAIGRYGRALAGLAVAATGLGLTGTLVLAGYAVTLMVARDHALGAERISELRALDQQVALGRLRARLGLPGVGRRDLDEAVDHAVRLGVDDRPARFAASELDMAFPPPEVHLDLSGGARVAIDPDGDRVAWVRDGEIAVYDLLSGAALHRARLPDGADVRLDGFFGGGVGVSVVEGDRLTRYDGLTGRPRWSMRLPGEVSELGALLVSADEHRVAWSHDGRTTFLSAPDGAAIADIAGVAHAFSTDGRRALLAIAEGGPHRQLERFDLVEVDRGEVVRELRGAAGYLASPDLEFLVHAAGAGLETVRWDGAPVWADLGTVAGVHAAPPDRIAVFPAEGRVEVRDLRTGAVVLRRGLGLPPGGDAAVGGGGAWLGAPVDGWFHLWSLSEHADRWRVHDGAGLAIAVSPDGELAATTGWEGDLAVWDWRSHRELVRYRLSDRGVRDAAFSPDGRWVATADREGAVRLIDLVAGTLADPLEAGRGIAMAVRWHTVDELLALYEDGSLVRWQIDTRTASEPLRADLTIGWTIAIEGDLAVVSGRDGVEVGPSGELWDLTTGTRRAATVELETAYGAAITPDGSAWAVGLGDGRVVLVDRGEEVVVTMALRRGPAMSVGFSPDGTLLAIGTIDGRVVVVDRATRTELYAADALSSAIQDLVFVPGSRTILGIGGDPGTVVEVDLDRAVRLEASALTIVPGAEPRSLDWLATAARSELRGDWRHAAVALDAAIASGLDVDPVRLARARMGAGDRAGALVALGAEDQAGSGTRAAWRRALAAP